MKKGFRIIQSSTGVSPYMWALFTKLSFYFIFQWSTTGEIVKESSYRSFSLFPSVSLLFQKDG